MDGVKDALEGLDAFDVAPSVTILEPEEDIEVGGGTAVSFMGLVADDHGLDQLVVQWSSDIDGVLVEEAAVDADGYTSWNTATLSEGTHVITLSATDAGGLIGSATTLVDVIGDYGAPVLTIVAPEEGEEGVEDETFLFAADVVDDADAPDALLVTLLSDRVTGEVCTLEHDSDGLFLCESVLATGDHALTFRAEDSDGKVTTVDRFFRVLLHSEVDDDKDGFAEVQGDCDDDDKAVYPGAKERPNGIDDDCDGIVDEGTENYDDDGDGMTEVAGDCDDADAEVFLDNPEVPDGKDNDCDGTVDEGTNLYDDDGDGFSEALGDCDDADPNENPGTPEVCDDGLDNDCSGVEDDEDAIGCVDWWRDGDGDGYGNKSRCLCDPSPSTYYDADEDGDCDDGNASVYPGANEVPYDGLDNDCADGDLVDVDGDGYVATLMGGADCDDYHDTIHPGVLEDPDGQDQDCDGLKDEGTELYDDDGDGYCEAEGTPCTLQSWQQAPWPGSDCLDSDDDVHPDAVETCEDGVDSDCSGTDDDQQDALDCTEFFLDSDGDGEGHLTESQCWCAPEGDYDVEAPDNTDCDDEDNTVSAGADEIADGIDNNCDDERDEGTELYDDDGDGFCESTTYDCTVQDWMSDPSEYFLQGDCDDEDEFSLPGGQEVCHNGADDDCSGIEDDGIDNVDCTVFYRDADFDDYGHLTESQCLCDADGVYDVVGKNTDCDDDDPDEHPGATELPDGADDDCDGEKDEETVLYDDDGDGYCESTSCTVQTWMPGPSAYFQPGDCDDSTSGAAVHPGATETCSTTVDDDCDNDANDLNAVGCSIWYQDADYDGQGHPTNTACYCTATAIYDVVAPNNTDCDDTNPNIGKGGEETQNRVDDDCDGDKDEGTDWFDDDGDGYCESSTQDCTVQTWMTSSSQYWGKGDCDDNPADDTTVDAADVNPGAAEVCNDGVDNNCLLGQNEENASGCSTWHKDQDGDNYGHATDKKCLCAATSTYDVTPSHVTTNGADCRDDRSDIRPGLNEAEDGEDNDCDGLKDEGTTLYDDDGDGYCEASSCTKQTDGSQATGGDCIDSDNAVYPNRSEVCNNGKDDNCKDGQDEAKTTNPSWSGYEQYYKDQDADSYGHETDYRWLCDAGDVSYYDETDNLDCYDGSANAKPNAGYQTVGNGNLYGSWDWDCDDTVEKQYTGGSYSRKHACSVSWSWTGPSCVVSTSGWLTLSSSPACGDTEEYLTAGETSTGDCSFNWSINLCEASSWTSYTQGCK